MGERMIDHLVEAEALRLQTKKSQEGDNWEPAFERQLGPNMHAWGESDAAPSAVMPAVLRTLPMGLSHLHAQGEVGPVMIVEARDGDRTSVGEGKRCTVRVDSGGVRSNKKK